MRASLARAHRDERGFTLAELLVVMVIIGILAAIAIPTFIEQKKHAHRAMLVSDMVRAIKEVEFFAQEENGGGYLGMDNPGFKQKHWGIGFRASSDDIGISMVNNPASTETTYCLRGSHSALPGEYWRYKRGVDSGPVKKHCKDP